MKDYNQAIEELIALIHSSDQSTLIKAFDIDPKEIALDIVKQGLLSAEKIEHLKQTLTLNR